jgi:5'-3' exonuclease
MLVEMFEEKKQKNLIISGDRDLVQLVSDYTSLYTGNSKNEKIFIKDEEVSHNELNSSADYVVVQKEFFILRKIIIGDKGDNVPNILKGFGEKTFEKMVLKHPILIKKLKQIENLYDTNYQMLLADKIQEFSKKQLDYPGLIKNIVNNTNLMLLNNVVYRRFKEVTDYNTYKQILIKQINAN